MTLEQVFYSFEQRLFQFGQRVWPPDPAIGWKEETERLCQEIQFHGICLRKKQMEARGLREIVFKREVQATILNSQIESWVFTGDQSKAWQQALELDHIREELQANRRRLSQLEGQCSCLNKMIRQRENRLQRLQNKLAAAKEGIHSFQ